MSTRREKWKAASGENNRGICGKPEYHEKPL